MHGSRLPALALAVSVATALAVATQSDAASPAPRLAGKPVVTLDADSGFAGTYFRLARPAPRREGNRSIAMAVYLGANAPASAPSSPATTGLSRFTHDARCYQLHDGAGEAEVRVGGVVKVTVYTAGSPRPAVGHARVVASPSDSDAAEARYAERLGCR